MPLIEGHRLKYRCTGCRQDTVIPTFSLMMAAGVAIALVAWLAVRFLSGELQLFIGAADDRAITLIGAPIMMIVCVQMVLNGIVNRLKFPVIKERESDFRIQNSEVRSLP